MTHPSTLKLELTTCHTTLTVNALGPPMEPGQHVHVSATVTEQESVAGIMKTET